MRSTSSSSAKKKKTKIIIDELELVYINLKPFGFSIGGAAEYQNFQPSGFTDRLLVESAVAEALPNLFFHFLPLPFLKVKIAILHQNHYLHSSPLFTIFIIKISVSTHIHIYIYNKSTYLDVTVWYH